MKKDFSRISADKRETCESKGYRSLHQCGVTNISREPIYKCGWCKRITVIKNSKCFPLAQDIEKAKKRKRKSTDCQKALGHRSVFLNGSGKQRNKRGRQMKESQLNQKKKNPRLLNERIAVALEEILVELKKIGKERKSKQEGMVKL